jgi:hypothetical protein
LLVCPATPLSKALLLPGLLVSRHLAPGLIGIHLPDAIHFYGYLGATFVRDKDAVMAARLVADAVAFYKAKGRTLFDALFGRNGWSNPSEIRSQAELLAKIGQ